jgi:T5orf172 domain
MFTADELTFLKSQGIAVDDVLDARGKPQWAWKSEARHYDKQFILGSPCAIAGHRLRTRAGHCIQCDPAKIAYQRRHSSYQYVYIAGSLSSRVVKIGTAVDCAQRERQLQKERYGGIADWLILFRTKVADAGKIELEAHGLLRVFRDIRRYDKVGQSVDAGEILRCSFDRALSVVADCIGDAKRDDLWMSPRHKDYDF